MNWREKEKKHCNPNDVYLMMCKTDTQKCSLKHWLNYGTITAVHGHDYEVVHQIAMEILKKNVPCARKYLKMCKTRHSYGYVQRWLCNVSSHEVDGDGQRIVEIAIAEGFKCEMA